MVVQHLTVARVAEGLGVSWNTANDAVLAEGKRVLIDDRAPVRRRAGHRRRRTRWRHTRRGDKYVTVIIDLTPIRDGTGPARLLDMVEGRSKQAFKTWLADRDQAWRDGVEVVAMDGFTGFKTATTEELPDAVAVMDPVPRRAPGRRRARRLPPSRPAGHPRTPRAARAIRSTAPAGPCTPAPTCSPTSRRDRLARPVRRRRPRRGRGDLGDLPAHDRRLPRTRPRDGPRADEQADRAPSAAASRSTDRGHHARPHTEAASRRRAGLLRPTRHAATARPRRSTDDSNTSAAPPSDSATSPTTSPDRCSRPADSDPDYTLDCEEPLKRQQWAAIIGHRS